jgi:hypothetical protein
MKHPAERALGALLSFVCVAAIASGALAGCGGGIPGGPQPSPSPSAAPSFPALWPGPTTFAVDTHMAYNIKDCTGPHPANCNYDPEGDDKLIAAIAQGGWKGAREQAVPWFVGPHGGPWNFAPYDHIYGALEGNGITPLFLLANATSQNWTQDLADLKAFAAEGAVRWPLAVWELENEPDAMYGSGNETAAAEKYWADVAPIAQAIKTANPSAYVITGGTQSVDLDWQQGLVDAGAFSSGLADADAVHTYGEYLVEPPGVSGGVLVPDLEALQALLPAGTPVWITEYGQDYPTPEMLLGTPSPQTPRNGWLPAIKSIGPAWWVLYEACDCPGDDGIMGPQPGLARTPAYNAAEKWFLNNP